MQVSSRATLGESATSQQSRNGGAVLEEPMTSDRYARSFRETVPQDPWNLFLAFASYAENIKVSALLDVAYWLGHSDRPDTF